MDIITLPFETKLTLKINQDTITVTPFVTQEAGNIKLGVNAPRSVRVDREEIFKLKQRTLEKS